LKGHLWKLKFNPFESFITYTFILIVTPTRTTCCNKCSISEQGIHNNEIYTIYDVEKLEIFDKRLRFFAADYKNRSSQKVNIRRKPREEQNLTSFK
jgi:hypothetical protein